MALSLSLIMVVWMRLSGFRQFRKDSGNKYFVSPKDFQNFTNDSETGNRRLSDSKNSSASFVREEPKVFLPEMVHESGFGKVVELGRVVLRHFSRPLVRENRESLQ